MIVSVIVEERTASIFGVYKWKMPIVLVLLDPEYGLSLLLGHIMFSSQHGVNLEDLEF